MLWIVSIFFFATTIWLLLRIRRTRQLIAELEDSVKARRCLLSEASDSDLRQHGVKALIDETNAFIESSQKSESESTGYSKQIAAMLEAIKEVVVIFDDSRIVEFSNKAAEQLFHNGMSMRGLRVDSVIRSVDLLDFLEAKTVESPSSDNHVSIIQKGQTLWFEAICSNVSGIKDVKKMSSLLVLHDITRLKTLEVMRRDFVANVSHELRTPLTIIKGFAETLVEDHMDMSTESRERFLEKILTNSERLHVLVEDLLTISRLESMADENDAVVQPLKPLFESIVEDYEARLQDGQSIVIDVDSELQPLRFDRFRIHQVLDNLVVNAFRYATGFSQITLGAKYDADTEEVVCTVMDDGPGIPEEDLPHLFERFYRVDKGRSVERGGTGLGLSIVKHIIQLHGGSVSADSRVGEWTKIRFTLPCPTKPAMDTSDN
ncbi:MAG: sensor histidine kinase [Opitutaceae bacterium]